jgi:hypothetical protein
MHMAVTGKQIRRPNLVEVAAAVERVQIPRLDLDNHHLMAHRQMNNRDWIGHHSQSSKFHKFHKTSYLKKLHDHLGSS